MVVRGFEPRRSGKLCQLNPDLTGAGGGCDEKPPFAKLERHGAARHDSQRGTENDIAQVVAVLVEPRSRDEAGQPGLCKRSKFK